MMNDEVPKDPMKSELFRVWVFLELVINFCSINIIKTYRVEPKTELI